MKTTAPPLLHAICGELLQRKFHKALLLWDYHGSGHERRYSPDESSDKIQERLDSVRWQDNSGAVVVVPELEEWLWHSADSVAEHFGLEQNKLVVWIEEYATRKRSTFENVTQNSPKELFESICIEKLKRTISPRDFEDIGTIASVKGFQQSSSFRKIVSLLQRWFPV
jgi:hypothetical protein